MSVIEDVLLRFVVFFSMTPFPCLRLVGLCISVDFVDVFEFTFFSAKCVFHGTYLMSNDSRNGCKCFLTDSDVLFIELRK